MGLSLTLSRSRDLSGELLRFVEQAFAYNRQSNIEGLFRYVERRITFVVASYIPPLTTSIPNLLRCSTASVSCKSL